MENTLMELVESGERVTAPGKSVDAGLAFAARLESLGFLALSAEAMQKVEHRTVEERLQGFNYIRITQEQIRMFLKRKAEAYNRQVVEAESDNGRLVPRRFSGLSTIPDYLLLPRGHMSARSETFSEGTIHSGLSTGIGRFVWAETPIEDYGSLPPIDVLDTLEVHKMRNIFDYFTVASVNEVPDPLLLGRFQYMTDRYFIAQWGSDISLDDVI